MLSATISLGILKVKFVIIIFLQFCLKFQSLNLFYSISVDIRTAQPTG